MSLLTYLGTYMGHSEFRDTLYYVHLSPERLRKSAGIDGLSSILFMGRLRLMKKIKEPQLFKTIKEFLIVYLFTIRKKSESTVDSYKFAINLYLIFIQDNKQKSLTDVTASDFNRDDIMAFMDWLEKTRNN